MASVVKLSKSGEANCLKANLAIQITKKGLEPFVENVIQQFQQRCLTRICNRVGLPAGTICTNCCTENVLVCPTNRICKAKRGKCIYHRNSATQYRPSGCPNKICHNFKSEIQKAHWFNGPEYINTDATQWCTNPWEVAKCFLPPDGYANVVSATETDFNGIVSIILNHKDFDVKLNENLRHKSNVFEQAREIGRLMRHSATFEVKDQDLQRYFQVLQNVLSDGACLASDNHAQNAVKQLLQLQNGVTQDNVTNGAYGQLRTAKLHESTTLTKKIKRKTELSPRISCIYDGRPIILEDDDRKRLDENCIFFKKGGFGEIFKVEGNNVFNIPLAIKKIKTNKDRSMRNLALNEMVVSRIRHQFILPLLATCFQEQEAYCEYWFISPFCENGDLLGALQLDISRDQPKLEVEHRIKILFQIEKALEYLHTPVKGVRDAIIHKDVTSSNILLDGKVNARLIDFGIAREKNDVTNCRSGRDTYSHDDVGISAACEDWDYFSFGVVVREVLTSLTPEGIQHTYLKKMTKEEIMTNIQKPFEDNSITAQLNTIADFCLKSKEVDDYKSKVQNGLRLLMISKDVTEEKDLEKCHLCMVNPKAGDVKAANHHCINVCVSCEKTSFLNPIRCHCGNEIQPRIGYKWGALLVAGEDIEGSHDFTQDVLSFKEVITSRAPLIMGISESSIHMILPDKSKSKQSQRIVDAIENLPKDLQSLVINISCHGSREDPFSFHLSASDTLLLTTLEEELQKYQDSNNDFIKVILFCDCCFPRKINIKGIKTEKIIQINSSKETQRSWAPNQETSYFSKFLIQGLKANTENAPCGTKDCTSCKTYWNYRKDYVTVENLFGYIHNHIEHMQEPQLLFNGSYDDSVLAYYTDEQECIEFTVHDDSDTETQRLLLDFSSDMCQIEAQLLEKSQKDKDSYTVAIQKLTFRTDTGWKPCKTFKEVVLAWESRQPLQVAFNPKNEQMEEDDDDGRDSQIDEESTREIKEDDERFQNVATEIQIVVKEEIEATETHIVVKEEIGPVKAFSSDDDDGRDSQIDEESTSEIKVDNETFQNEATEIQIVIKEEIEATETQMVVKEEIGPVKAFSSEILLVSQPKSMSVKFGACALFSCEARCSEPLKYQWFKDGKPLKGEVSSEIKFMHIQDRRVEGFYQCLISVDTRDENMTRRLFTRRMTMSALLTVEIPHVRDNIEYNPSDKVALLIGNSDYKSEISINASTIDVHRLSESFRALDFRVVSLLNLTKLEIENAVLHFKELLGEDVYAVFYFCGHGFEEHGMSYLVPTNASPAYTSQECVCAQEILANIQEKEPPVIFMILDICRQEPKVKSTRVPQFVPKTNRGNTVLCYATSVGLAAYENKNGGLLVNHLTPLLRKNIGIDALVSDVKGEFAKVQKHRKIQIPQLVSNLLENQRSLTDKISKKGQTEAFQQRDIKWNAAHQKPDKQTIHFEEVGVVIELDFQAEFSNLLHVFTTVIEHGRTQGCIGKITYFSPPISQQGKVEEFKKYSRVVTKISLQDIQKLKENLIVDVMITFFMNNTQYFLQRRVNLGQPLVAKLRLWELSHHFTPTSREAIQHDEETDTAHSYPSAQ